LSEQLGTVTGSNTGARENRAPFLCLENQFFTAWEVAGDAIAHEFVTEDTVAISYTEGHAHEIGESAEL